MSVPNYFVAALFAESNPAESSAAIVTTVIVGVLAFTTLLAWGLWRVYRSVERAERDPKYLRRHLLFGAAVYVGAAALGIVFVVTGHEPVESLVGLPVVALFAWFYVRQAMKVRVPPK